jgi:hypothetical protein
MVKYNTMRHYTTIPPDSSMDCEWNDCQPTYLMGAGILGEASLTLWLLGVGVDAERWEQQAMASRRAAGG